MILPVSATVRQTGVRQRGQRRMPNLELKRLRINRGWGRKELSRVSGVSTESIRLAELGFVPGPGIQFALAHSLDREPLDIWPMEVQR